ncbi:hypothetical protein Gpo141_00011591 [Globisporangium polare]
MELIPLDDTSTSKSTKALNGNNNSARLPALEGVSPAGGFVSIFTPVDKSRDPESEEIDANGIRLYSWSSAELRSFDYRSGYFWAVTLCPCFPVAQLESRLGLKGYARALATATLTYAGFFASFIGIVITFFSFFDGGDKHSNSSLLWFLLAFCFFTALIAVRIAKLRTIVRARFMIPGSERDDGYVGCLHSTRAIRQMGHHLKCDRAVFCTAPSTLHAYEV